MSVPSLPKVAILTNIPAPYRVDQFNRLAAGGRHEYLVYFCAETEPNRQWRPPAHFDFRHELLNARPYTFLGGYSYFVPSLFPKLWREGPRVVIVGGFSFQLLLARLYGWLARAGVIVLNDSNILLERSLPAWRTKLRRWLVRGIDGAIACSQLGVDYFRWLGVSNDRITLSRLVNDAASFADRVRVFRAGRADERRRLGLPGNALVVLFVGRLEQEKGVVELLRAFGALCRRAGDDIRLLIVGDGSLHATLRRYVTDHNLASAVAFAGFNDYEDMPRFYAVADLAVVPSLEEPYGLVVNEGVAAGVPVLCSMFAGARDLVEDGRRGVVFNPRDPAAFESALLEAVDRVRKGAWTIPVELPSEMLPEKANAALEDLVERTIHSKPGRTLRRIAVS